jgi:23S rRNA pseudouridine955/2504/2580 synthase
MTAVRTVTVAEAEGGQRLDRWFRHHFPGLGHGRLEKLLRTGQIRVDGHRAKSGTRLEAGQQIRVPPLPPSGGQGKRPPPGSREAPSGEEQAALREQVLYRDDWLAASGATWTPSWTR